MGNLTSLLKKITPAVDHCSHHTGDKSAKNPVFVDLIVRENAQRSVEDIRLNSPVLSETEQEGLIKIVGAYFDMDNGEVTFYESNRAS